MKKIRFYLGRALLNAGLRIMPFEAKAHFGYNVNFLHADQQKAGDGK